MDLQQRLNLLVQLGEYILQSPRPWQAAKEKAFRENGWFNPEFIDIAVRNIATEYLEKNKLESFANTYNIPGQKDNAEERWNCNGRQYPPGRFSRFPLHIYIRP